MAVRVRKRWRSAEMSTRSVDPLRRAVALKGRRWFVRIERRLVRNFTVGAAGPPECGRAASLSRPQVRREYPLSLSISLSGGKETYQDSLSNGERTGKSPA